jgi:hypothetical protein
MAREDLDALTKEELIDLLLKQAEQLAKLQADYEALKLKFEQNQKKPPTTSKNSSQPPSRDQKGNQPKGRRKRRLGPPPGHEKHERKFVAQADEVIKVVPQECCNCYVDLSGETVSGVVVKVLKTIT